MMDTGGGSCILAPIICHYLTQTLCADAGFVAQLEVTCTKIAARTPFNLLSLEKRAPHLLKLLINGESLCQQILGFDVGFFLRSFVYVFYLRSR